MDNAPDIAALRQILSQADPLGAASRHGTAPLGCAPVDAALKGGLSRGAVHEIFPARDADLVAATGFALGICLRAAPKGPFLWIRQRRTQAESGFAYAPGLRQIGIDPGAMVLVTVQTIACALRAGLDALRCPGLGAVIIETWGASRHIDATASRRLALAAKQSGITALMVRIGAEPTPGAAASRWRVAAARSSDPLGPSIGLPGNPAFSLDLLRQRGGAGGGHWVLEWNHETFSFRLPALSGAVPAAFVHRPAAQDRQGARAGAR